MRREPRERPTSDHTSYFREPLINGFHREHSQPSNTNCRAVIYLGIREKRSVVGGMVIGCGRRTRPRNSERGSRKTLGRPEGGPFALVGGLNTDGRMGPNG